MKILQITGSLAIGGLENVAANIVRHSPNQDEFHFLIYEHHSQGYEAEMKALNCKIHCIPRFQQNIFVFLFKLFQLAKKERFDVVHIHTFSSSGYMVPIFKALGTKKIVVHSHTEGDSHLPHFSSLKKIYLKVMRYMIQRYSTHRIAVGKKAGESLFDKEFIILPNGINIDTYTFSESIRESERMKYGLAKDELVVGHIGRFSPEKNQVFILNLFKSFDFTDRKIKIFLIGEGDQYKQDLYDIIQHNQLEDHVTIITGITDTSHIINLLDVLVFPSLFEGIPLTLIEAQVNGLPIIASSTIDPQVNVTGNIDFLDLEASKERWLTKIMMENRQTVDRGMFADYDVEKIVDFLSNHIYRSDD